MVVAALAITVGVTGLVLGGNGENVDESILAIDWGRVINIYASENECKHARDVRREMYSGWILYCAYAQENGTWVLTYDD